MSKYDFINILKVSLEGEASEKIINENTEYYSNYIDNEIAKGKKETEVLQQLGDPRLIAKTIIETNGITKNNGTYTYSNAYEPPSGEDKKRKGFNAEYHEKNGWDVRLGNLKLNTWYGKLLLIALVILILFVLGHIAIALLPLILPVIIVFWLVSFLTNGGRK